MITNERIQVPGRRLGRKPASFRARLKFADYLTPAAMTATPASVNHLGEVAAWNLGSNNRFGTCAPTSAANFTTMAMKYLAGADVTVADADIFALYRQAGNPGFDPTTGADDNGCDMNVLTEAWVTNGLMVTYANGTRQLVKPLATASINPQDVDTVRASTALLGGVLFGFNMTVAQQSQQTWSPVAGSAAWGGHAVFGGAYTSVAEDDEHVISWAQPYGTTDSFLMSQAEEAFVAILPQALTNPAFQAGVNLASLGSDWTDLTGKPFPDTASPAAPA